jgi:23S rRNA-/tRNA-specific pseudouridylate synthase
VTTAGQRRVPVPEGLDGERLDAALARMFGLSRTLAAELIGEGLVLVGGRPAAKSDRVPAGEWLEVTLPAPVAPPPPQAVPGLAVVYEDTDSIVVDKRYHALVQGHPDPLRGTVDAPIARHPSGDGRFAVVAGGRHSVTHYDTVEAFRGASLVEIILETGRTHQIRVHMSAVRHPCAGDRLYGADPVFAAGLGLTRQWLHAVRLGFAHPADGRRVEFTSEYSPDLAKPLDTLRAQS